MVALTKMAKIDVSLLGLTVDSVTVTEEIDAVTPLTEAQAHVLHAIHSRAERIVIAPITRKWLVSRGLITLTLVNSTTIRDAALTPLGEMVRRVDAWFRKRERASLAKTNAVTSKKDWPR